MNDSIDILLAVHNGGKYLVQLIESIINQTYSNWRLIIREEGSIDNSFEIACKYAEMHPDKIVTYHFDEASGACQSFSKGLTLTEAPYIMLADQDDVWLPEKIELTYNKMKSMESKYGNNIPLMVYSDLKIVDSDLKVLHKSLWKYRHFNPENGKKLGRELLRNIAYGCTIMLNKHLKDISIPIPQNVVIHDWWLPLVALVFGKSDYIKDAPILYRRHESNASNLNQRYGIVFIFKKFIKYFGPHKDFISPHIKKMVISFLERYREYLDKNIIILLNDLINIDNFNFFKKRYKILQHGFLNHGFLRNIGLLWRAGSY